MGWTYLRISEKFGYSHQRVWQIVNLESGSNVCIHCNNNIDFRWGSKYCLKCKTNISKFSGRDRTREIVRMRDKYTCKDCKKKWIEGQRRFDVHHINGLCGKLTKKFDSCKDLLNMITLCHKCHFNRTEHKSKKTR